MKKIILCLLLISCLGLCFGQTSEIQSVINNFFETELKKSLPFLDVFPFDISEKGTAAIKPKQYVEDFFGSNEIGRCYCYTLIEEFAEEFTYEQKSTLYTPYEIKYSFDNDGLSKVIYLLRTKTNFYWLDDVLSLSFETISNNGKVYTSELFDYAIEITLDAEDKEDGFFYTTITVLNLNNLYINF